MDYSSQLGIDLEMLLKVGDEMQAKVRKFNDGEGRDLSFRESSLIAEQGSKKLRRLLKIKTVLTAKVNQVMKGGLGVIIDETRIFIPASPVSDVFVKDLSVYMNKDVSFIITEYNPKKRRRIIGDCKQLIVAVKEKLRRELLDRIKEGDTIEGTVKNVTDFCAFIDLRRSRWTSSHLRDVMGKNRESSRRCIRLRDSVKVLYQGD